MPGPAAREYDDGHGGAARAHDAAAAVDGILDRYLARRRRVLDLAAGPASVARLLFGTVVALDRSPSFTTAAARHLPGRVVRAEAHLGLPLGDDTLDAVVTIWWLHLTPDPDPVLAEVGRVLRPGGFLVTTVDKLAVDEHATRSASPKSWRGDATATLAAAAHTYGLDLVGAGAFPGHDHPGPGTEAIYPVLAFRRRTGE